MDINACSYQKKTECMRCRRPGSRTFLHSHSHQTALCARSPPCTHSVSKGHVVRCRSPKCIQDVRPLVFRGVPLSVRLIVSPIPRCESNRLGPLTCNSRIELGSTETSATAISLATLKLRESAIFTVPPAYRVGAMLAKSYE